MCPELNTISDSNQPQQGGWINENGLVYQGQLIMVIKTEFVGVEKIPSALSNNWRNSWTLFWIRGGSFSISMEIH